jgi:thiosulfate dehydrogenase [quinone] large subunit
MNATAPSIDRKLAYGVFRLTLGINLLIHGAGRLFGAGVVSFATKMGGDFINTPLPHGLVHSFLVLLPFAEAIVGLSLTLGIFTRWGLTLGGLLMAALVFGTALRSDWTTVGIQMIYALSYYLLLANLADNRFSLDTLLRKQGKS